ncbi:15384_t:CDS:2 [Acaulospora morrowiae]|uniref:15384_t:CDS:1 n=1 Tax=Acaulospora morrowiae TaxID=94023 RepID=A0A9N8ZW52_9GLOM|nr:15384_t:CDS:2 [Acaulospora morrowiae]
MKQVQELSTKWNKLAVLAKESVSEPEMPLVKDLDCENSRKRGHNAENCPKENKFSQGSSETEGMQLDEDGELEHSSKDLYTMNPEEQEMTTGHPSKDLKEHPDNDGILMTEDKRNNNINEREGNTGGCLEEKKILMRADPATKKSNQPSRIIVIREEDTPLCKRNSLTINLILKTLSI